MEDLVLIAQVIFNSHDLYAEAPVSPLPCCLAHISLVLRITHQFCREFVYIATQILETSHPNPALKTSSYVMSVEKFVAVVCTRWCD